MKSRIMFLKLSLALLILQMQTSTSVAFQSPPSIIAVSKMCNHRMSTLFMDANKIVSPVMQQQQHGMLLLSNQGTAGRKELNNKDRERRPTLKLGTVVAAAAAFASVFTKASTARAAAAAIVLPVAGSEEGVILPLLTSPSSPFLGMNIKNLFKVNRNGVVFFSALTLLAVTTAVLRSIGDGHASMMHISSLFGRTFKDDNGEKSDLELGLPKEVDWGTYAHSMIEPLSEEKKSAKRDKRFPFDMLNLFKRIKSNDEGARKADEESRLERATRFFLEQKYKLHHHPVHVPHSRYEIPTYLQSLAVNVIERHDVPKGYLDTLSTAKFSTWDAYQHQLDKVKPANEVDELKQGVSNLQDLMEMEQSMYHTSNQVLKLAIDAHHNELQHASTNEQLKEFDDRLSIQEELKAFDKKAMEYEEIVMNGEAATRKIVIPNEENCKVTNFPV